MNAARFLMLIVAMLVAPDGAIAQSASGENGTFFESNIRPVLVQRCIRCHGPRQQKSSLRLDSREALLRGGARGPAIVPDEPEQSLLIQAIRHSDEDLKMPPDQPLSAASVSDFRKWVTLGASWPAGQSSAANMAADVGRHWAFQPIRLVDPPADFNGWSVSPIDRFIWAELDNHELTPVESADKQTLIRRATFDLIGLPPTPDDVDGFLADESPNAFAGLVERLLSSPHYGERWGRHWLDVVRYADTAGETADYPVPEAFRYRNYVIAAFNQDKPYDEFIREQIAGDILARTDVRERYAERVTATGFLALTRRFGWDRRSEHHVMLSETIDTIGQSILGLTLGCARCHDHKYDPIPTSDYYALYGILDSTRFAFPGCEAERRPEHLVPVRPMAEIESEWKPYEQALRKLDVRLEDLAAEKKTTDSELNSISEATTGVKRSKSDGQVSLENAQERVVRLQTRLKELADAVSQLNKQRDNLRANPPPVERAYAVWEGQPGNARIQQGGDPKSPGAEVPRRFLTVLGSDPVPKDSGSGRLQLAQWLTRPTNPLTARVMVNRIWQHHFGEGLVRSPNNFGMRGNRPTHPELLDYMAARFMESGWSVKALHRLIMLSRVYQLSSQQTGQSAESDPDNRLWSRFSPRRLDVESVRDAMLVLSGGLDRSPGGPHPFPPVDTWNFTQHNPFRAVYATDRRSVYLMIQRNRRHPTLALFDGADPRASTAKRGVTTTPAQALFMLNNPFVHRQASLFAARVIQEQPDDSGRLQQMYRLAFARPATTDESHSAREFLDQCRFELTKTAIPEKNYRQLAWESLARSVLGSNEFIYID